jgi:hypothetical protein
MARGYVDVRRGYLEKHLLPYFADVKLTSINPRMIEEWITALRQKEAGRGGLLSPTTINQCLATLRIMLGDAERLRVRACRPSPGRGCRRGAYSRPQRGEEKMDQGVITFLFTIGG